VAAEQPIEKEERRGEKEESVKRGRENLKMAHLEASR